MPDNYSAVNIRSFIDNEELNDILAGFSCPLNHDVENFLWHNSVDFTQKNQSVTYLVFSENHVELAGYFSIAIKPVSVLASVLSNSMRKKISRVSVLNEETNTYTASAYLIAQLGKNFALPERERINGSVLLSMAHNIIAHAKYFLGGVIEFLECENKMPLMNFYIQNRFKFFSSRITKDNVKLNQLLRFI